MYALIVYIVLQGQIQTIQLDSFSSKEKCQQAYYMMEDVYKVVEKETDAKSFAYCVLKD